VTHSTNEQKDHLIPVFSFCILFALWLLASGHFEPFLVSLGVVSCAAVVLLCRFMGILDHEALPIRYFWRGLCYVPWWAMEVAKANIAVARLILAPRLRLSPRVFEVRASQKTDLGCVFYAQSITTTPGTVSIIADRGRILVHAITEEMEEGLREGEMDRRVTAIEGPDA